MYDIKELEEWIYLGMDINLEFLDKMYYIGAPAGTLMIADVPTGDNEIQFKNINELLDYKIMGKTLRGSFNLVTYLEVT